MKAKQEKKEQEKLKGELTSKGRKQEALSETKSNADSEGQMEDMKDHHIDIEKQIINEPENAEDKPQSELKPTDSVIKRGIPMNTKPAPPVVAIPMAELLGVSDDTECPDVEGLKCEADPQSHVEEEKADQVEVEETPTLSQSILYEHESIDNTDYDVQKCLEQDQFDVATISQPTEGGIKRGVPKNVKPAPAVVAIKMAELLTVPDDEMDLNVQDSACATVTTDGNSENEADDKKKQQLLEKQRQDEKLKLEKELNQKEKLKKEEEARAIKEQEKLAKLRKKEEEKLKREDEARAKKEKDLEEKRQKQIREKIEKQKKEEEKQKKVDEAKAKKEKERKAKLEKQEKEKLGKLQKEQEAKAKKQIELAKKKSKEEQQIHDNDENKVPYDSEEGTREDFEQENDEGDTKGEFKPTESVIKRGKPKNTKPSPAVVAIKMADLLSV